jgi:tetratricopeptide (TPR) repeat protein
MDEIRRIIREVDPPRPSMRMQALDGVELTTAAKRRHTDPAKLPSALRGDIDWIVMKCLEKDRTRRYDTANGVALDLLRHLNNEVITARPPTGGYLLGKLIKRNKSAVIAGGTALMALIVGFAIAVWQAQRANHEAMRVVDVLDELRATAPAFAEQARALAAKEQFAEAVEKLDYALKLRPPNAGEYLVAKGDLLQCQLKLAKAAAIYREALRVQPDLVRAGASAKLCDELLAGATQCRWLARPRKSRQALPRHAAAAAPRRGTNACSATARRREEAPRRLLARTTQRPSRLGGKAAQRSAHRPR